MEGRDVVPPGGLWPFAMTSLVGATYGRLDNLQAIIFYVATAVVGAPTAKV